MAVTTKTLTDDFSKAEILTFNDCTRDVRFFSKGLNQPTEISMGL